MLLDNCSIHKAKDTREAAQALGITFIWNVPYKPAFNGIEYVWQQVKLCFKQLQLQRMVGTREGTFEEAIHEAMLSPDSIRIAQCCRRGIRNVFENPEMFDV